MAVTAQPRRATQARGRARRQALLQSARELLASREIDDISLTAVAEHADIPASSTYHFYADMRELYKDLARSIALEMIDLLPSAPAAKSWSEIVHQFLIYARAYFNEDAASRKLLLGPKTTPDIKEAGCGEDFRFGNALKAMVAKQFQLPELPDPSGIFYRAVRISDAMFSISVAESGSISEFYLEEARLATCAYLSSYLPRIVPRRKPKLESTPD